MKEFLRNDTVTYNLISFTGYRALILFKLLTESPKSYEDIRSYFETNPYIQELFSMDSLRMYLNNLKVAGCTVEKTVIDKIPRYYVPKNPFNLKITPEQKKSLIKIYKTLTQNLAVEEIVQLDNLLLKLVQYIDDENFVNDYKKVSVLKRENTEIVTKLQKCCETKKRIIVSYNSPHSGIKDIEMITQKLLYHNNKLYLRAKGLEYKDETDFLISRIIEIKEIKEVTNTEANQIAPKLSVIYKLKTNGTVPDLESGEKLLEIDQSYATIMISGSNSFYINQRLLEYGSSCTVISPTDYKENFLKQLKEIRGNYD